MEYEHVGDKAYEIKAKREERRSPIILKELSIKALDNLAFEMPMVCH